MTDWCQWPPTLDDLKRELSYLQQAVVEDQYSVGVNYLAAGCLDSLSSGRWPMIHRLAKMVADEKSRLS